MTAACLRAWMPQLSRRLMQLEAAGSCALCSAHQHSSTTGFHNLKGKPDNPDVDIQLAVLYLKLPTLASANYIEINFKEGARTWNNTLQ